MTMSVVVQFSTSKNGYEEIKKGSLIEKPGGRETEFFVGLIKEYNFANDCMVCSFANGYEFELRASAAHKCEFTILYFTLESIKDKISANLQPRFEKAEMCYDCKDVDCLWMNEETAAYSQDYVFAYRPKINEEMPYFGIEINQYIMHHSMMYSNTREKPKYVDCKKGIK